MLAYTRFDYSSKPNYTISDKLLFTVREIGESMGEIKSFSLTGKALAKLELEARELSSFASTSIEGNPLALTDVKYLLKNKKEHIRDTEREVLNYNKALQKLYRLYAEVCGLILVYLGSGGRNAATIFSLRYSSSR